MDKIMKLTDSQYNTFKQHEANLYIAVYYNMPPVFQSRALRDKAESELFELYREITGYTLNQHCDMCACDNWKALGRLYINEKKRRCELQCHSVIKLRKRKYTKKVKNDK